MNAFYAAAFSDELEKISAAPQILRKLWRSGAGRALAGGAVGAGTGALADPSQPLSGAIKGGLLGAGAGYASPLLTRAGRRRAVEGVRHLGRKAKHELTGKGNAPAAKGVSQKELAELRKAEKAGLTSVPGVIKGMATRPLSTMREAWRQGGTLGKAMAVGDVALSVPHIRDTTTEAGTGEKALGTLGSATGYMLGGRMGLLGSSILGSGLGYLGRQTGRLIGGRRPSTEGPPERPTAALGRRTLEQTLPETAQYLPGRGA